MARVGLDVTRPTEELASAFAALGVATVHEAQGRKGLLHHRLQARQSDVAISGSALTCEVPPGDNWMLHVALEQAKPGDILIVTPTSPCDDGYWGDLLATSAMARGIKGIIIDAGVRDIMTLRQMRFPVWSKTVSAQGTVKETVANVQTPIMCAGQLVNPGDIVVADDDGVCIVPQVQAPHILERARVRDAAEEERRQQYAAGALSLDLTPSLRDRLSERGLKYG